MLKRDDRVILAHVVIDPDAWYDHAVRRFGEEIANKHLAEKVARWIGNYEAAVARGAYKTRAERELEEITRKGAQPNENTQPT